MKISYCVTCHNENIEKLMTLLFSVSKDTNDEIVLQDDFSNNEKTIKIIEFYKKLKNVNYYQYPLNNDYGTFKNQFIQKANNNFIFAIDGDEMPPESLIGENLHALIESNPSVEAYVVPRINDFKGVTSEHAKQWGWNLTESQTYKRPIVNFPDHQWRIFKRDYPRISFKRKLHEKIEGYNSFVTLPASEEYALYHDKTIEKQIETNLKYNKIFSVEENLGHGVFK